MLSMYTFKGGDSMCLGVIGCDCEYDDDHDVALEPLHCMECGDEIPYPAPGHMVGNRVVCDDCVTDARQLDMEY